MRSIIHREKLFFSFSLWILLISDNHRLNRFIEKFHHIQTIIQIPGIILLTGINYVKMDRFIFYFFMKEVWLTYTLMNHICVFSGREFVV